MHHNPIRRAITGAAPYNADPSHAAQTAMEDRLTELEIRYSFTEDLIETLNRTVFRQQQQIEALQRELRQLRQLVQDNLPDEPRDLREDIPPHY